MTTWDARASALPVTALQIPSPRGPADPLADHLQRVRVGVGRRIVAEARVPDATSVVDLAPRDRMVRPHQGAPVPDERMRLDVVRALVERLQHVDRAPWICLEVVKLVRDLPALREIFGGRMLL